MFKLPQKLTLPVILCIGLILRLPFLSGSLWMDEAAQALESSRPLKMQHLIADDFQPPLLHYIVHFMLFLSREEAFLRLVSVVSGLVSIAVLFSLLKRTVGRNIAIISSVLLAINPFHVFFSQELRSYALAAGCATLSWWALMRWKEKHAFAWFVFATVGGMYSMYLYPFIFLAQALYVCSEQRGWWRSFVKATIVSVLFCIPWLPFFLEQLKVGMRLTQTLPGWAHAVATPQIKALPLVFAKFVVGQVDLKDSVLYMVAAFCVIVIGAAGVRSAWKKKQVRYLVYWLLVPVVLSWLVSFAVPVIQPKRVMTVLPAFVGLLGYWIGAARTRFRLLVGIMVCVVFLWMNGLYFTVPRYQRENWRRVISIIESQSVGKKSVAVFAFPESIAPWRWYEHDHVDTRTTKMLRVTTLEHVQSSLHDIGKYEQVFLFDYLRDLSDPSRLIEQYLAASGYRQIGLIDGGNVGFVRVYSSL